MSRLLVASTVACVAWIGTPEWAAGQRPAIDSFVLWQSLASAQPRLGSCNPPASQPTERLRWCYAARSGPPLALIFLGDSLVQWGEGFIAESTSRNATAHWQERAASLIAMFGAPPDSISVKPAREWRGIDPRGAAAQVFTAYWRASAERRWCASVFMFDMMRGPDTPITRGSIDVYTALRPHSACDGAAYHQP